MKWWKLHSGWLERQSRELSSTSTYTEKAQLRDNLFVSTGEVLVRLQAAHRFPILIVYPDATPYEPPKVYLLNQLPDAGKLKAIASATFNHVPTVIRSDVKFYHRRHQGPDGSLCIIEGDHLYAEAPALLSIGNILDRIRDWFTGHVSGRFPPDSAEVELYYHFPHQASDIEILVTEPFFDEDIVCGEFCASTQKALQTEQKRICVGLVVLGEDGAGISRPPKSVRNPQNALFADAPDIIAHLLRHGADRRGLGDSILWGHWTDLPAEIEPFSGIDGLVCQIGAGDVERGYDTVLHLLEHDLTNCVTPLYFGTRYPGRRSQKEWQVFRLSRDPGHAAIIGPSRADLISQMRGYSVEAIRTTAFTDGAYHMRNSGRANRGLMRDKRVTILGCGALGGEIADTMVKAGVGRLYFVDPDVLRPNNLVRHVLGMEKIGQPKAVGMYIHATLHNPFIESDPRVVNVLHNDLGLYFLDYSVGISSIADDNVEAFINEQAVIAGRTVFYVRALRGGKAARIFRAIPGVDACKHCLSLYHQDKDSRFPVVPPDDALPTLTNECNNPIRPASAADLKTIAGLASRDVLDHLENPDPRNNHWIWTTESLPGFRVQPGQSTLRSFFIPPRRDCPLCGNDEGTELLVDKDVLQEMRREVSSSGDLETGGVLTGFRAAYERFVIRSASGPGPKAVRTPGEFRRDVQFCQAFLDEQHRLFGNKGMYLGEWHYHPVNSNQPSNRDLTSLSEIAVQDNYLTDRPVMLIFDRQGRVSSTVHPFNRRYASVDVRPVMVDDVLRLAGEKT